MPTVNQPSKELINPANSVTITKIQAMVEMLIDIIWVTRHEDVEGSCKIGRERLQNLESHQQAPQIGEIGISHVNVTVGGSPSHLTILGGRGIDG
jgi:hypothetical protein